MIDLVTHQQQVGPADADQVGVDVVDREALGLAQIPVEPDTEVSQLAAGDHAIIQIDGGNAPDELERPASNCGSPLASDSMGAQYHSD